MPKYELRWTGSAPIDVGIIRKSSGKYAFTGTLAESVYDVYTLYDRYFNLTSIHLHLNTSLAFDDLKNNISDYISDNTPIGDYSDFIVPTPVMSSKIVFLTGYNYTRYQEKVKHRLVGSALANFGSFSIFIYLAFSFVIASIIGVIFAQKMTRRSLRRRKKSKNSLLKLFLQSIEQFGSNNHNRWIQFSSLMTIFTFSLLFSFAFQSQQLISDPPKIIRSFDEMVNKPNCTPLFFNSLFDDSSLFKNAPNGSMRSKVWQKGLSLKSQFVWEGITDMISALHFVRAKEYKIFNAEALLISNDFTARWATKLGCSMSAENEYFVPIIKTDETEKNEQLLGYPFRHDYKPQRAIINFQRILLEYGLIAHWRDLQYFSYGYMLLSVSKEHIQKQTVLCSINSILQDTNNDIIYPNWTFIKSFLLLMIGLYTVAGYILLGERIYYSFKHKN